MAESCVFSTDSVFDEDFFMFLKLNDQDFIRPGIQGVRPKILKTTSALHAHVSKDIKIHLLQSFLHFRNGRIIIDTE